MNDIRATIVCDSVNKNFGRITTLNIKYGRFIHPEFLRHRQISRSVKSSRAIPAKKLRSEVMKNTYMPVKFGKNQKGMQSKESLKGVKYVAAQSLWRLSALISCAAHFTLEKCSLHKEVVNRVIEPYMYVEETITATDWDNLFTLRIHDDAQEDIRSIVEKIKYAMDHSEPKLLEFGEYHVPYLNRMRDNSGVLQHYRDDEDMKNNKHLNIGDAIMTSIARCARSSYVKHDSTNSTLEEDRILCERLIRSLPPHSSPMEHIALADLINNKSRNFTGNWMQYRQIYEENFL